MGGGKDDRRRHQQAQSAHYDIPSENCVLLQQTGVGNAFGLVSRVIENSVQMSCFRELLHQSKNFIPVDHLVNAIIHLSRQNHIIGQSYNMVPQVKIRTEHKMAQLFRALKTVLHAPLEKKVPYDQWPERLKQQGHDNPLTPIIPILEEMVFGGHNGRYDTVT
ncbi:hypothetical protein BJX96DRAFT_148102 [Aspergillus floccosus]